MPNNQPETQQNHVNSDDSNIFTGYLIVVEKSEKTLKMPKIEMTFFPVMSDFLADEQDRGKSYVKRLDGTYSKAAGIAYLDRYDVLCKRLMMKGL